MQCLLWFVKPHLRSAAVLLLCLGNTGPVWSTELLAFPALTGVVSNHQDGGNKQEIEPKLDIYFSMEQARIQLLGEFFVNSDEREMERLQIGIAPAAGYKIWAGRFHTPISYWNTAYHHGAYLQPSITRPGIAEYEHEQGVMPMHTTGILVDGLAALRRYQLNYSVALGFGPVLREALEPVNVFKLDERGKLSLSAKFGWLPHNSKVDETGIFAGYLETPVEDRTYTQTQQLVAGVYSNQEWGPWRFVGEITVLGNRLDSPEKVSHTIFSNAYGQGEYKASHAWTGYGRLEAGSGANNPYLNLFPGFIRTRALMGARWKPFHNQAVKFELMSSERQDEQRSTEFAMQWSMVFP